jgi:hypothetical protein
MRGYFYSDQFILILTALFRAIHIQYFCYMVGTSYMQLFVQYTYLHVTEFDSLGIMTVFFLCT